MHLACWESVVGPFGQWPIPIWTVGVGPFDSDPFRQWPIWSLDSVPFGHWTTYLGGSLFRFRQWVVTISVRKCPPPPNKKERESAAINLQSISLNSQPHYPQSVRQSRRRTRRLCRSPFWAFADSACDYSLGLEACGVRSAALSSAPVWTLQRRVPRWPGEAGLSPRLCPGWSE